MGLFDSIYVDCPHCGKPVEFQSKADEAPYMERYTISNAPTHILTDVLNRPTHCKSCDGWLALVDPTVPIEPPRPRPSPRIAKVRTPENPETHFQGFKWWPDNTPFTNADILEN